MIKEYPCITLGSIDELYLGFYPKPFLVPTEFGWLSNWQKFCLSRTYDVTKGSIGNIHTDTFSITYFSEN